MDGKKNGGTIGIIIVLIITIVIGFASCGGGGSSGDGKSTCRNCGRNKSLSYMGYCSTCQEGFNEWQDSYYGND